MDTGGQRTSMRRILPVLAVAAATGTGGLHVSQEHGPGWWPVAQAAEAGHSGGHSGSHGDGGSDGRGGDHDSRHTDNGHDHDDGVTQGGTRGGQGGSGRHRGYASGGGGSKAVEDNIFKGVGRRPVWAQEAIPEVELGRLNVSRAPSSVLERAEGEALVTYYEAMAELYSLDADQAAALLRTSFFDVSCYDSPLQNLALYKDVMISGDTLLRTIDPNLTPASQLDLAAIFLGSASDKTIPISEDTVTALNRILNIAELSQEERSTLATKAETVREAILTGHGPVLEH